jgi:hypothetical protein
MLRLPPPTVASYYRASTYRARFSWPRGVARTFVVAG